MSDREQMRDDDGLRREGDRLVTEALSARPAVSVGAVTLATMTREEAPAVDVPHDLHETAMSRWRTPAPEPAPPASDREALGRLVREVWIAWAREQPNPKPSWLVPWEGLSEPDKEVDRRIGERLAAEGARAAAPPASEDENAQAERWARLFYAGRMPPFAWEELHPGAVEAEITAMLPLVREARAAVDRVADGLNVVLSEKPRLLSKVQAERDAALREIERLCVRPAPLTEKEAGQIARTFTDGLAGFDLPEDVEALTDLLVRISRGDIPPDVRAVKDGGGQ